MLITWKFLKSEKYLDCNYHLIHLVLNFLFLLLIFPFALSGMEENHLESRDLKNASLAIYRERRKKYPTIPKNRTHVHDAVRELTIKTNKSENFLLINDVESGILIFSCLYWRNTENSDDNLYQSQIYGYSSRYQTMPEREGRLSDWKVYNLHQRWTFPKGLYPYSCV